MSITAFAVRNYRFVIVVTAALFALGVLGFLQMPRQEDPNLSTFGGVITVVYPGASLDEVEDRVLKPVEEAAFELEEVESVESSAQDNVAIIRAEFRDDVDKDDAYDLLVQRVTAVQGNLPEGTELTMRTMRPLDVVVLQIALFGKDGPVEPGDLKTWADELESRLRTLSDAAQVTLHGERNREVHVTVNPSRLAEAGLSLSQVADALAAARGEIPGGLVQSGPSRFTLRPAPRYESIDDVRQVVVGVVDGRPVRVEHVADVAWGYDDPTYLTRYNGRDAVMVTATQKEGRNIFHLSADVLRTVDAFRRDLPPSIELAVVHDQSASVRRNLTAFGWNLVQGAVIIVALVALVAGWRSALVVLSALILSVGMSFFFLQRGGTTLQQMSIAGLITVLGLLVDNAIVVTEGILQSRHAGRDPRTAAIEGTNRVAAAVASSTATTVAAFVPMILMEGSVGEFTRDIPTVVSFVLLVSLVVALVVTPLLGWRLFRSEASTRPFPVSGWIERRITGRIYSRALDATVRRPWTVVAGAAALSIACLSVTPLLGMSFFPAAEKPMFLVNVETPQGTNTATTSDRMRDVETWLLGQDGVTAVAANVGKANPQIYYNQLALDEASDVGQLFVTVEPKRARTVPDIARRLRARYAASPDLTVEPKILMQGPPVGLPVSIELTGPDLGSLSRHAATLEDALRRIPGAVNVANDLRPGAPRLDLRVDPVTAGKLGLNSAFVAREVRLAMAGGAAAVVRRDDDDYDVVVRVAPEGAESFADLERIRLPRPGGAPVPLAQLTRPVLSPTYAAINHTDLKRSVIVGSDVEGRLAADVLADLMPAVKALDLGPEESWRVIGEDEERDKAFLSMLTNLITAIGLIYGILVLQFKSFKQPLIVFTALPVALTGSALGLLVGGWSFGFTAFIGLLALTGIVVNNAIVLVDEINRLRDEGHGLADAIRSGAASRLQPIFLTTGTTVAGLLPLTLTHSTLWSPMGWIIIGGLSVSTLVTLLLVPALYAIVERRGEAIDVAPALPAVETV